MFLVIDQTAAFVVIEIFIDFIKMRSEDHRTELMNVMKKGWKRACADRGY